jgi:hypothetical protein
LVIQRERFGTRGFYASTARNELWRLSHRKTAVCPAVEALNET